MARDAAKALEQTRQKLINSLLNKKQEIERQLKELGHQQKTPE